MDYESLIKRVDELERETARLREMTPSGKQPRILRRLLVFFVSNWEFTACLVALATAIYVKFHFNIDYFETYRNSSQVKNISEFHREMGDEMFMRSHWAQAVKYYQAAVAANPANIAAALGVVKAQVSLPDQGQTLLDPSILRVRLEKLRRLYPDDPQVAYLEAIYSDSTEKTLALLEKVIAKHHDYPDAYLRKASIQLHQCDYTGAIETLNKLLAFDAGNGTAHCTLGLCHQCAGQFDKSLEHYRLGQRHGDSMNNAIAFAEALRMNGEFDDAYEMLYYVHEEFEKPDIDKEYYAAGGYSWFFLPVTAGDVESPKLTVDCYTMDEKRALLHISQGMINASMGEYADATDCFNESLKAAPSYRDFLVNRLRSAVARGKELEDENKTWMTNLADQLAKDASAEISPPTTVDPPASATQAAEAPKAGKSIP